jgi:holo-[acyl-carrier protein] synthase
MIVGIGTDLCETRRVQAALSRHGDRFARRILGDHEWPLFQERQRQSATKGLRFLASRFAVKEAFSKAIGTGVRHPMTWRNCETVSAENGQPQLVLGGDLRTWFEQRGWSAHVSIADEVNHVLAFVLVETRLNLNPLNQSE